MAKEDDKEFQERCKKAHEEILEVLKKHGLYLLPTITMKEVPGSVPSPFIVPPSGFDAGLGGDGLSPKG